MKQAPNTPKANVVAISSKKKTRTGKLSALEQACADVVAKADKLHEQHTQFHKQYVERSNDALYALLANMQQVCMDVLALQNCDAVVKKLRTYLKKDFGIKTNKNTTAVGLIVRYTLRGHRKTMHVYTRALQAAIDAGVKPAELADYIRERGGIDKMREAMVTAEERAARRYTRIVKQEAFTAALLERHRSNSLGTVEWNSGQGLLYNPNADFSVLIATYDHAKHETAVIGSFLANSSLLYTIMEKQLGYMKLAAEEELTYELVGKWGTNHATVEQWQKSNGLLKTNDAKQLYDRYKALAYEIHERNLAREAENEKRYKKMREDLREKSEALKETSKKAA